MICYKVLYTGIWQEGMKNVIEILVRTVVGISADVTTEHIQNTSHKSYCLPLEIKLLVHKAYAIKVSI
jgi:hypothetical protein